MRRYYLHAFTEDENGAPVDHRYIGETTDVASALVRADQHAASTDEIVTVSNERGRVLDRIERHT